MKTLNVIRGMVLATLFTGGLALGTYAEKPAILPAKDIHATLAECIKFPATRAGIDVRGSADVVFVQKPVRVLYYEPGGITYGPGSTVDEIITLAGYTEFLAQGTTVRFADNTKFFSAAVSGTELFCHLDAGYAPVSFVMGNVAYALGLGRGDKVLGEIAERFAGEDLLHDRCIRRYNDSGLPPHHSEQRV